MHLFTVHEHKKGTSIMIGAFRTWVGAYQLLYWMGITLSKCVSDMGPGWIWYGAEDVSYKIEKWEVGL